jgi:hypothetical protein
MRYLRFDVLNWHIVCYSRRHARVGHTRGIARCNSRMGAMGQYAAGWMHQYWSDDVSTTMLSVHLAIGFTGQSVTSRLTSQFGASFECVPFPEGISLVPRCRSMDLAGSLHLNGSLKIKDFLCH